MKILKTAIVGALLAFSLGASAQSLIEHRIESCDFWTTIRDQSGFNVWACSSFPRTRYVADSRSFANVIDSLEKRIKALEQKLAEQKNK
jgi:hypothetical protein